MTKVVLLASAHRDLQQGYAFYEDVAEGRGEAFVSEVDRALEFVKANPMGAPVSFGSYRRILVRRFPFGVFYVVE